MSPNGTVTATKQQCPTLDWHCLYINANKGFIIVVFVAVAHLFSASLRYAVYQGVSVQII